MGARGPLPTPTPILEARDSKLLYDREKGGGEPRPEVAIPPCPAWLSKEAKAEWKRQTRELKKVRCIAQQDRALLAAYCEAWARFVKCVEVLEAQGTLIKYGEMAVGDHPMVAQRDKAIEQLIKLADRFGFAPATRARCRMQPEPRSDDGEAPKLYSIR